MDSIKILDVKIDIISKPKVLDKIKNLLNSDEFGKQLCTTNPEFILATQKDEEFKNIINNSWLSVADGYGIRLAAKYNQLTNLPRRQAGNNQQSTIIKNFLIGMKIAWWGITRNDKKLDVITDVITGTDLVPEICKQLTILPRRQAGNNQESRIFLLGGFGDTPRLVRDNLKKQFNNLTIYHSIFEVPNIIDKINKFAPDILFVAVNHPIAQKWINKHLPEIPSVKLAIGVGGAFDYLSGKIKRAPESWRSKGLEWLWRVLCQPKRLKRIWNAWIVFSWKVFINNLII